MKANLIRGNGECRGRSIACQCLREEKLKEIEMVGCMNIMINTMTLLLSRSLWQDSAAKCWTIKLRHAATTNYWTAALSFNGLFIRTIWKSLMASGWNGRWIFARREAISVNLCWSVVSNVCITSLKALKSYLISALILPIFSKMKSNFYKNDVFYC